MRTHSTVGLLGVVASLGLATPSLAQASAPDAKPQLWVYCSFNLWVDANIDTLEGVMRRAAAAGYTQVLLSDSKFGKLGDMDARYFRNLERVKATARQLGLELVPAVFPLGYSESLLWHDPNLAEALPVRDVPFVVHDGIARPVAEPAVQLKGGDFTDLGAWDWHDDSVTADHGAAHVATFDGNARIVQKLKVAPYRLYHIAVRVKTRDFTGEPRIAVLDEDASLNFADLGVKATQDWTTHHLVFDSLDHESVAIYLGVWGGARGDLWWDDATIEEVGPLNIVRRDGAPLAVRNAQRELVEGRDFEPVVDPRMGTGPCRGGAATRSGTSRRRSAPGCPRARGCT